MNSEKWIEEQLAALGEQHQLRSLATLPETGGRVEWQGRKFINFSSNDYLDFLHRPELKKASIEAINTFGTGSGASRLVTGSLSIHDELETAIANHKGYPSALFFGSGFLTNIGVISALVGRNDLVLADRLVHASLIDAIRLSGARLVRFQHNDVNDLSRRLEENNPESKTLIITESVFSMDGDLAPLPEIANLANRSNAMLMVDEAHATGVFGPSGRGLVAQHNLQSFVTISMSTMSKALGGYGGTVACSSRMREWLINKARAFIYTTAPPPGVCGAAIAALQLLEREPELGAQLRKRAVLFRDVLHEKGFKTAGSESQIIPVLVGENKTALELSSALRDQGILVAAIRPPTVPAGTARLRFSITLAHQDDDLIRAAEILFKCVQRLGLSL
jgi:8-amino-7-oxononanoate synthase